MATRRSADILAGYLGPVAHFRRPARCVLDSLGRLHGAEKTPRQMTMFRVVPLAVALCGMAAARIWQGTPLGSTGAPHTMSEVHVAASSC